MGFFDIMKTDMCANNAFHFSNFHFSFHFVNIKAPKFHKNSTVLVKKAPKERKKGASRGSLLKWFSYLIFESFLFN